MNRNPFRVEADAFRVLLVMLAGALAVILVATLFGGRAGALLGLVLLAIGLVIVWRWTRRALSSPDE